MPQDTALPADSYLPPLAQLLTIGDGGLGDAFDCAALGLGREHAAELIRMATDVAFHDADYDSDAIWAPLYAWRALGQLQVDEAIVPLVTLLRRIDGKNSNDSVENDLPEVLGSFGKPALEPLAAFLADAENAVYPRATAATGLARIAEHHPALRLCIERLSRQLQCFAEQSGDTNGFILWALMDMKAVEAMPVIKQAFDAGAVNDTIAGSLEGVEIEFGLRPKPSHALSYSEARQASILTEIRAQQTLNEMCTTGVFDDADSDVAIRPPATPFIADMKTGRNDPCPCKSGKKFKKCCGK